MPPIYDIFLSYNSRDREAVREVHEALKRRSLQPWIDFEALTAGRLWQEEAEEGIERCRAAAVFLGPKGLGPWGNLQMRGLLTRAAEKGILLIPVFLPGAPETLKLPSLLAQFTWVDLRGGIDDNGIGRLIRGIPERKKRTTRARKQASQAPPRAHRLPGRPPRCFGREDEVRDLVESLFLPSPPPTPILGPPGVGKTTLTLEALHEPRVEKRYGDRRFFVRCDGARSRDALVTEVALGIGLATGPDLEDRLFQDLESRPAVLALDNAETPWEADTAPVEDLLTQLSTVPGLALVASVRGDQRPFGPRWREAIRVGPLGLPAARDTFVDIAGGRLRSDSGLDRLLEAVDRLPIAVVLMAHQAEGEPDLTGLWKQWQEKRTALLRRADGKERLTNIEVSLELSIAGPRMTEAARRLLSVLALLPDGVARQDLDALLPGEGEEATAVLRKVGLAFDQGTRLRVLAPVREYVGRQHPPQEEDLDRTVAHFLGLARSGERLGWGEGAEVGSRLVQELGNLDGMILRGLRAADPEPAIRAALGFGIFFSLTGWGQASVVQRALEVSLTAKRPELEAECRERLGYIALYRSDLDTARDRYEEALPLYRNVGTVLGEANCIQSLGDIALRRSDHDAARDRYEEALPLYRNVSTVLGEANCIKRLGDISLAHSDYDSARARYEEALPLYRNVGDVRGEANCIRSLGEIAFGRSDHDAARDRYEEALPLYRNIGDVLGEANCIQGLGDIIALTLSDPGTAETRFQEALELYRQIQDPYSIGWAHVRLARLAPEGSEERRSQLRAAREAWESIKRPDLVETLRSEFGELP